MGASFLLYERNVDKYITYYYLRKRFSARFANKCKEAASAFDFNTSYGRDTAGHVVRSKVASVGGAL